MTTGQYEGLNSLLWGAAITLVFVLLGIFYTCPFFLSRRGAFLFKKGRFYQSSQIFQRALFFSARDTSLWYSYALALRRASKLDEATSALLKAVELAPLEPQVYLECADALSVLGKHADALYVLKSASPLSKQQTPSFVLTRAAIELEARCFKEVERDCHWLIHQGNDLISAQAFCLLGVMKLIVGRTEEGEYDLDVSYLLDPCSSITRAYCAAILFHRGMNRQTVRLCNSIVKADPNCSVAYYYRGVAYRRLGELQKSESDLAKSQFLLEESRGNATRRKDSFFADALERIERTIASFAGDIS